MRKRCFFSLFGCLAAALLGSGLSPLRAQDDIRVGYAVLTADRQNLPAASALFSFRNQDAILVSEAGVGAVQPLRAGRVFVDRDGTQTGIALANFNDRPANVRLTLRDDAGSVVGEKTIELRARQHLPRLVDDNELFPETPSGFVGSLTFQVGPESPPLGAVTLRLSTNRFGEPVLATLPVAPLEPFAAPAGADAALVFGHIGAGGPLSTQILLINRGNEVVTGRIALYSSAGARLTLELDGESGNEFPYRLEPHGVFKGTLRSSSGIHQGYSKVTVESGSQPAGTAVFQFRDDEGRVVSEAGVAAAAATQRARIFVDSFQTQTGLAAANDSNREVSLTLDLLDRFGVLLDSTTRRLPARGHASFFVDSLFPGLPAGFTGILEARGASPVHLVTLKLSVNARGDFILTTLPVADLQSPPTGDLLIFPQLGFGGGFETRLILLNSSGQISLALVIGFTASNGQPLELPLGGEMGSQFELELPSAGSLQLRPGNDAAPAEIVVDAAGGGEIAVNTGQTFQLRPSVVDSDGVPREDFSLRFASLDEEILRVDQRGRLSGMRAGFATLTVSAGGLLSAVSVTVVDVTAGASAFEVSGLAQDMSGRLFLASSLDHVILRSEGLNEAARLYAGTLARPGFRDAKRLEALFSSPARLALNQADGSLFVADSANHVIRRVLPGLLDRVETAAGTGVAGSRDGPALEARFRNPTGLAFDDRGNLWISDRDNHVIRRWNLATGMVETVAGLAGAPGLADGVGEQARFNSPAGIALEQEPIHLQLLRALSGDPPPPVRILAADSANGVLRRVSEDGTVETVTTFAAATTPQTADLPGELLDVASDGLGNAYLVERGRLRVLLSDGRLVEAAQLGTFDDPRNVVASGGGRVLVADGGAGPMQLNYGAPEIESIEPETVDNRGGDQVTVRGRNFAPDSIVVVGGEVITQLDQPNTREIRFTAPPLRSGTSILTIQHRGGLAQGPIIVRPSPLSELPPGFITTAVGGSTFTGDGGPAPLANLDQPHGLAVDPAGNLYIADRENHRIRRLDMGTGILTTVAGDGVDAFGTFGNEENVPATSVSLSAPEKLAVDGLGNIYISSFLGSVGLRKVTAATGLIRTVVRTSGFHEIAADRFGDLFISQQLQHRIVLVDQPTGTLTPIAGTGQEGFSGDGGPASQAALSDPQGMGFDAAGNLFIVDRGNGRVRRVDSQTGVISSVARLDSFGNHESVALDPNGDLYVGSFFGVSRFDGETGESRSVPGVTDGRFIAVDGSGSLYQADPNANRVFRVDPETGRQTAVAGNGEPRPTGDGGPAFAAALVRPAGIAVDGQGNLLIADEFDHRVRRVDARTGVIATIAGTGDAGGFEPPGSPPTETTLFFPSEVAAGPDGTIYIGETVIRRLDPQAEEIETVAMVSNAQGLEVGPDGSVFFSTFNDRVMRLDPDTGELETIAGTGQGGYSGDGGPAVDAALHVPQGLAVDGAGNVYVADSFNDRVRRIDAETGIITTAAGGGSTFVFRDGLPASEARLTLVTDLAIDPEGNLVILVPFSILRVNAQTGLIQVVARETGSPFAFGGDNGPATQATYNANQIAVDGDGNIYLTDNFNGRVRVIRRPN